MLQRRWYNDFSAAQRNGILPNEKSAKAMRYKKAIFWTVDINSLGIGSATKTGEWTVTITNADESQLFFKQTVKLSLMLVSLSVPGLSLFTWNVINGTSGEKYETTMVAGVPTTPATIGQFVQGGTALSEQGIAIPGSGNESTDQTATILFDYYSPTYLFKSPGRSLPIGYKVKVSRDTWGIGTANSTYGWAFEEGSPQLVATHFDGLGALLSGWPAPDGERVFTARAWPGGSYSFRDDGAAVKGTSPTLHELSDGRELLILQTVEGVVELESRNSEWSWRRVLYPDAAAGFGLKQDVVFGPEFSMPLSLRIDDDSRLVLAQNGAALYSRIVTGEGVGEQIEVGPATADVLYSLERTGDGTLLVIGGEGVPVFQSKSIPPRWTPVKKEAA